MKIPTIKQAAEFCGTNEQTMHNWKKAKLINDIKVFEPFGKHNLFLGAMISAYLFNYDYKNEEEAEFENNFERLIKSFEEVKKCCKTELTEPIEEHLKAIQKIKELLFS